MKFSYYVDSEILLLLCWQMINCSEKTYPHRSNYFVHAPKLPKVVDGTISYDDGQFDILAIITEHNEQEAKTGALIQDFETKILDFFRYACNINKDERS